MKRQRPLFVLHRQRKTEYSRSRLASCQHRGFTKSTSLVLADVAWICFLRNSCLMITSGIDGVRPASYFWIESLGLPKRKNVTPDLDVRPLNPEEEQHSKHQGIPGFQASSGSGRGARLVYPLWLRMTSLRKTHSSNQSLKRFVRSERPSWLF